MNIVHISKFEEFVNPGSIILFRCSTAAAELQRTFTRAQWDHVAIVVPTPVCFPLPLQYLLYLGSLIYSIEKSHFLINKKERDNSFGLIFLLL